MAASAGLVLDGWQAQVLVDALGERGDHTWAALEVGLVVPRQNGKGSILEARELAGLFLFKEDLILHSAHEYKTAAEAFLRIRFLVENTPDLSRLVRTIRTSHGEEGIELMSGARLRFVARSGGSGRGFSGDTIILDEAYNMPPQVLAALFPTMSARKNPQIWYTSSAPLAGDPKSDVLRGLCRRGRQGVGDRLTYLEWCASSGAPDHEDRDEWRRANPGFGIRITDEFVEAERVAFGEDPDGWARERLGVWHDTEDGRERVLPVEAWLACEDPKSGPQGPVQFGLDVNPSRSSSCFVVAAQSGRGGVHVEITSDTDGTLDCRSGTWWVVERARELQARWGGAVAVASGSPAASLVGELTGAGVRVVEVSTAQHAQACGGMFDAVAEHRLKHLGQIELSRAVDGADRKFYGDSWLWDRRHSQVDISPLVAATLAKWSLEQTAPLPEPGFVTLDDQED